MPIVLSNKQKNEFLWLVQRHPRIIFKMSFDPENEGFKQVEQDMMQRLQTFFNEKISGLVTAKDRSILAERNRFDSLNESVVEIRNEKAALEKEIERLQKMSENDSHTINDLGSQVFIKMLKLWH